MFQSKTSEESSQLAQAEVSSSTTAFYITMTSFANVSPNSVATTSNGKRSAAHTTSTYDLSEILSAFERDIDESDRELDDALRYAESLLTNNHRESPKFSSHKEVPMTDDSSRTDISVLTEHTRYYAPNPTTPPVMERRASVQDDFQMMAAVTPTFALSVAKVLGGQCPIAMDGSTAKVPVDHLLEALQQLMEEREEFLHETLELMEISRRTINMAFDMKRNEEESDISID